jgi:hypothetical protein
MAGKNGGGAPKGSRNRAQGKQFQKLFVKLLGNTQMMKLSEVTLCLLLLRNLLVRLLILIPLIMNSLLKK